MTMRFAAALVLSLALLSVGASSDPIKVRDLSRRHHAKMADFEFELTKRASYSGQATFYDVGTGNAGACGDYLNENDHVVALNQPMYGNLNAVSKWCNTRITISDGIRQTTAVIKDACPETTNCHYGALDMSRSLFNFFRPFSDGVFQMTWWPTSEGDDSGSSGGGGSNDDDNSNAIDEAKAKAQAAKKKAEKAAQDAAASASRAAAAASASAEASRSRASASAYAASTSAAASRSSALAASRSSAHHYSVTKAAALASASAHRAEVSASRAAAKASASRSSAAAAASASASAAAAAEEAARPKNLEQVSALMSGLKAMVNAAA
ncbi:hypothetical protein IE53DRAFT_390791 [Violaceomyces palustris]|uniref:Uncharacterized protein n=1 Tax=Violaceomyces palustris TaxID=1673888 RepID=A0ACD0NML8_9BASI|nr:hypothetical protein IE53DRAFT_390791 [Violaceomyces palustris]